MRWEFENEEGAWVIETRQDIRTLWHDVELNGSQLASFDNYDDALSYVEAGEGESAEEFLAASASHMRSCGCGDVIDPHLADCPIITG